MTDLAAADQRCNELLATYPQAAERYDVAGTEYYLLRLIMPGPVYAELWRPVASGLWELEELDDDTVLDQIADAIPVPRDGSVFGYVAAGRVTALIVCYSAHEPPTYSVMPRVGEDRDLWPPFTGQGFGPWFWELYQQGAITDLAPLIAANPGAVFWTSTGAPRHCAVMRAITGDDGVTLQLGVYAYHRVITDGYGLPSLGVVLATPGLIDLSSRFQESQ